MQIILSATLDVETEKEFTSFIVSKLEELGAIVTRHESDGVLVLTSTSRGAARPLEDEVPAVPGEDDTLPSEDEVDELPAEDEKSEDEKSEDDEENITDVAHKKCIVLSLSTKTQIESKFTNKNSSELAVKDLTHDTTTDTVRFSFGGFSFTLPSEQGGSDVINPDHDFKETTIRISFAFADEAPVYSCYVDATEADKDSEETLLIGKDLAEHFSAS